MKREIIKIIKNNYDPEWETLSSEDAAEEILSLVKSELLKEMPEEMEVDQKEHHHTGYIRSGFTLCRSQVLEAIDSVLGGKE